MSTVPQPTPGPGTAPVAAPGRRRRQLFFALLYFSEGAPIGWLWWTLPTQLRRAEISVVEITALTSALAIPWSLKFLWAPAVDLLRGPRFGLRGWVILAQLGMIATLVPILGLDPANDWGLLYGLLLTHAFFAATQDVAIDGWAIRAVPEEERGELNAAMQVGMIGGRVLFSSGVLYLSAGDANGVAVPMLLAVLGITLAMVVFAPLSASPAREGAHVEERPSWRSTLAALRSLITSRSVLRLVAVALIGGAGFEAAGSLSGSWLVDRGLTDDGIATFRLISAGLMAAGAVAGGWLAGRVGALRATSLTLVSVALVVAVAALLNAGSPPLALAGYGGVYLALGAMTAASYALFMGHAAGPLAATIFSAFMGMTNACEAWAGRVAGILQADHGYGAAMMAMAAASLIALVPLRGLRNTSPPRQAPTTS
ncbi:muropeptide transporter [Planctomycetes bacterium Poly30]|uniref:Muropeptide transporter n=1 Tax=Saltatorellus ferox TaxID=2528018 RepID=A0A518ERC3_9BACT|nr:muropeptide transporter [Planctomycetes bacterium Poly30]